MSQFLIRTKMNLASTGATKQRFLKERLLEYVHSSGFHGSKKQAKLSTSDRDLWTGFHTFECPTKILEYRGEPSAVVTANLFMRGAVLSMRAQADYRVSFPSRTDRLSKKIGTSPWSLNQAYKRLEKDRLVQRDSQKFTTTRVSLLNPKDGSALTASPGRSDLLTVNGVLSFVMPLECLKALNRLKLASPRAVYISAFALATAMQSERFKVAKSYWQRRSGLGRHAFERGLAECKKQKLLSYWGETLTVNDPRTGKLSRRPAFRVPMPVDFNAISTQGWERVCMDLLGGTFEVGESGWSRTTKDRPCPYCGSYKSFSINFSQACFKCFNCHEGSKLGFLAMKVLGVDRMFDAATYIKNVLENQIPASEVYV